MILEFLHAVWQVFVPFILVFGLLWLVTEGKVIHWLQRAWTRVARRASKPSGRSTSATRSDETQRQPRWHEPRIDPPV